MYSNVLPLHLKQIFPSIIDIAFLTKVSVCSFISHDKLELTNYLGNPRGPFEFSLKVMGSNPGYLFSTYSVVPILLLPTVIIFYISIVWNPRFLLRKPQIRLRGSAAIQTNLHAMRMAVVYLKNGFVMTSQIVEMDLVI